MLGQKTRDVLADVGYSAGDIATLRKDVAIGDCRLSTSAIVEPPLTDVPKGKTTWIAAVAVWGQCIIIWIVWSIR